MADAVLPGFREGGDNIFHEIQVCMAIYQFRHTASPDQASFGKRGSPVTTAEPDFALPHSAFSRDRSSASFAWPSRLRISTVASGMNGCSRRAHILSPSTLSLIHI